MMQHHILQQKAGIFIILALILLVSVKLAIVPPVAAQGQVLQQMDVERVDSDRIFTFQDYPDYAAVYVESTIPGLSIDSNMGIVADLSDPEDGVYRVIIDPIRQSLYFRAPGYREYRLNTGVLQERQVLQLNAEPLDRSIVETGDLLIRSEPSGAQVTLDGIPGSHTTPHSFTGILAQTYNVTLELEDYELEQVQITVDPLRPTVRDIVLTPVYGFLNLNTPDATLFLSSDDVPEYRVSYTPGQDLRLDTGTYQYRIRRSDYEDATGTFTIEPGQTNNIDVSLKPTYGNLIVDISDAELFLRNVAGGDEQLKSYQQNRPVKVDAGTYNYRMEREFYQPATGTITIRPGESIILAPSLEPDFATMRVQANVSRFRLRALDNNAPSANRTNEINLERGIRTVEVSASGYADLRLRVRARPGERIDTTVVLESFAEREDREQREQLPSGILNVTADVPDAEIFINGERRGEGEISLSMVPDSYEIEIRHPRLGTTKSRVEVPSADVVDESIFMRPSKKRAVFLSGIIPGSGHLYTNRGRGYVYLAGAAAAAGFSTWSLLEYNASTNRYDEAMQNYQQANSLDAANRYRNEVLSEFNNQSAAYDNIMLGLAVFGGIYAVQMLDLTLFSPRYGYREREMQAGLGPDGINLVLRF